jgi:PII-like signaling protein
MIYLSQLLIFIDKLRQKALLERLTCSGGRGGSVIRYLFGCDNYFR